MNVEENIDYSLKKTTSSDIFSKFPCIGSSHGWLIFLNQKTFTPFLFNSFTELQIKLPSLRSFFDKFRIIKNETMRGMGTGDLDISEWAYTYTFSKESEHGVCAKAIFTAEPVGDYSAVLIGKRIKQKLGYCKDGDNSWTEFDIGTRYQDIICCKKKIFALRRLSFIDSWDLQGHRPGRRIRIYVDSPQKSFKACRSDQNRRDIQSYVVESEGEFLLILRFQRWEESLSHFARKTRLFQVYKLDSKTRTWVKLNSLGERSLFLGGNHSVSISTKDLVTCKRNSIYFTDNHWQYQFQTMENEWLHGHMVGKYSLEDESISPLFEFECGNFQPLPCWIVPN